jgi:hypothetical protein
MSGARAHNRSMAPVTRLAAVCAALPLWTALQVSSAAALTTACTAPPQEQTVTPLAVTAASEPLVLRTGATDVPLQVVHEARDLEPRPSLAARLRAASSRSIYLTLSGVSVQAQPGVVYNVYLNRPSGERSEGAASPHFLGALSFFNATRDSAREVALNVTPHLARLLERGELDGDLRLTIVPAGQPDPAASPRIQSVRLVAR